MTPPSQVGYHDVLRVWREADAIPEIEHAWLFDHLTPIGGDPNGPTFEGWTLLSALAVQTERLRLGLLVTSNRFRPPAMLAKIAATVDAVSSGRLAFGIGAGSRPGHPLARREYEAHGLPFHDAAHAVGSLAEACTVIRRLWTEAEPFDFDGTYLHLTGAFCNPKPAQRPRPPILIGGRSAATLRVAPSTPTCGTFPAATSTTPSAAAPYWTASAPRSAATPPRSPDPSSCRSPTTAPPTPGTRSPKQSTPASSTSFWDCPPHIPRTPHDGSPTSSSTSRGISSKRANSNDLGSSSDNEHYPKRSLCRASDNARPRTK
jgi:alkanesulfonate monooxygenase SsuD/methylene tetrahydromethanopterin reductase-like flavin-dependent oxidoreductase (luciferase family)